LLTGSCNGIPNGALDEFTALSWSCDAAANFPMSALSVYAVDDASLAAADESGAEARLSVQQQVQGIFKGLKADAPATNILSAYGM
jgi:hypothetical protein